MHVYTGIYQYTLKQTKYIQVHTNMYKKQNKMVKVHDVRFEPETIVHRFHTP